MSTMIELIEKAERLISNVENSTELTLPKSDTEPKKTTHPLDEAFQLLKDIYGDYSSLSDDLLPRLLLPLAKLCYTRRRSEVGPQYVMDGDLSDAKKADYALGVDVCTSFFAKNLAISSRDYSIMVSWQGIYKQLTAYGKVSIDKAPKGTTLIWLSGDDPNTKKLIEAVKTYSDLNVMDVCVNDEQGMKDIYTALKTASASNFPVKYGVVTHHTECLSVLSEANVKNIWLLTDAVADASLVPAPPSGLIIPLHDRMKGLIAASKDDAASLLEQFPMCERHIQQLKNVVFSKNTVDPYKVLALRFLATIGYSVYDEEDEEEADDELKALKRKASGVKTPTH